MTSKYCERCRTKTKRYITGRCEPCQRATDQRSHQRRQGAPIPCHYDKLIPVPLGVNTQQFRNIQAYRGIPVRMACDQQGNRYAGKLLLEEGPATTGPATVLNTRPGRSRR